MGEEGQQVLAGALGLFWGLLGPSVKGVAASCRMVRACCMMISSEPEG
jgi:hypothetical protein